MEDSEAKCDKCEPEVRPEPATESTLDKMLIRPEQLVPILEETIIVLEKQRLDMMGSLLGIGLVALFAVGKYMIFY